MQSQSEKGDVNGRFTATQVLLGVLGIFVPVLGSFLDSSIADLKRDVRACSERIQQVETSLVRTSTIASNTAEKVGYFTVLAEERGRRLGELEGIVDGLVRESGGKRCDIRRGANASR